jgi:hypothetical protein
MGSIYISRSNVSLSLNLDDGNLFNAIVAGSTRRKSRVFPDGVSIEQYIGLKRQIEGAHGESIDLQINDNSSTLISLKFGSGSVRKRLSLHRMFVDCEPEIIRALGQYLRRPTPVSRAILRRFMNARSASIQPRVSPQTITLRARGVVYDLNQLASEVNAQFFSGEVKAYITWSRGNATRRRLRHITFGTYDAKSRIIRIHPILDRVSVPEFVVKFIIYHEMLHAVMDPEHSADGRRFVHTAAFRKRERQHPDYLRAKQWEKEFLKSH